MTGRNFKASAQGSLDGLCGIYAIINACNVMLGGGLDRDHQISLFCKLTSLLDDGRPIGEVVHDGIGFRKLGELIDVASRTLTHDHGVCIERKVAWKANKGNLSAFWNDLQQHVNTDEQRVALLGVEGKHSHWTVARKVSEASITLADSDNLKRFNRSDCHLRPGKKPHQLQPTQTFFLRCVTVDSI